MYKDDHARQDLLQEQETQINEIKKYFKEGDSVATILSKLQHYGAKTNVVDFTNNLFIALFFACQNHRENKSPGMLYLVEPCQFCSSENLQDDKDFFPKEEENSKKNSDILIEPKPFDNRVVFQSSVLIYTKKGYIQCDNKVIKIEIPFENKENILNHLKEYHNINEETMYNDFMGMIQSWEKKFPLSSEAVSLMNKEG